MTPVSINDAVAALNARKNAAGLDPAPEAFAPLADVLGVFAGTDLTAEELAAHALSSAERAIPLAMTIGPIRYGASTWQDGLLTGLELARLRREEDDVDGRLRALRGALESVRRILDERGVPQPHGTRGYNVGRALAVIDVVLQGEDEDA